MAVDSESALSVDVWRGAADGRFQTFQVPRRAHQTILDVVTEIQRDQDATLSYRFACRVGMCGSCAMVVNGRPRWTCRTRVSEAIGEGSALRLEPLKNFTVVKDLAVEMTAFFDKWRDAKGSFEAGEERADFAMVPPSTPERQAANAEILGYSGMHLDSNQYVAEKIRPLLPLYPDNLKKQIWLDQKWWTTNGAEIGERWNKWMLSKA